MSWLKDQYENFQVGAAGVVDAIFDTRYAAETDAYITSEEAKEQAIAEGASEEEAQSIAIDTYEDKVATNIVAEDKGAIDEALSMTEQDIEKGYEKAKDALGIGAGILVLAVVLGAGLGIVYLAKKGGA